MMKWPSDNDENLAWSFSFTKSIVPMIFKHQLKVSDMVFSTGDIALLVHVHVGLVVHAHVGLVVHVWRDGAVAIAVANTIYISPRTWVRLPLGAKSHQFTQL